MVVALLENVEPPSDTEFLWSAGVLGGRRRLTSTLLMGTPIVMLEMRTLSREISVLKLDTSLFTLIFLYEVN